MEINRRPGGSQPDGLRDLLVPVKTQVDRLPSDAKFIFNDETRQLDLMEDSRVGRALDVDASIKAINEAIGRGEHTVSLVINEAQPRVACHSHRAGTWHYRIGLGRDILFLWLQSAERIQNIEAAAATVSWRFGCAR